MEYEAPQYTMTFDEMETEAKSAENTSPEQLAAITQKALSSATAPEIGPAPETVVQLPAGLITEGGIVREAEVQELTGRHEEALAKVRTNPSKFVNTLLTSGVVSIGDKKTTQAMLKNLVQGDIDALLLGIRKVTFGKEFELFQVPCENCGELNDLKLDLDAIPVNELEDPEVREFDVPIRNGKKIRVTYPNGEAQTELYKNAGLTAPELVTILLSHCILGFVDRSGNFTPSKGKNDVLDLGKVDRDTVQEFIYDKQPGPRYDQVKAVCSACESEVQVPLNVGILFRDLGL